MVQPDFVSLNLCSLTHNQTNQERTNQMIEQQEFQPEFYKVQAIVPKQLRVSRHGISKTKGGAVAGESLCWLHWRDTEIYNEEARIKEEYPDCEIQVVWKMQ